MSGSGGDIGLSFSGGGYRATAFSLGTMALLQDLELLGRARVMSSVSGGSLALAAYVCAKAGARPRQESEFRFYDRFYDPLMRAFADERFAAAFVRLPLLLQGEKVVLHAADATQDFLSSLLGQEACLGNAAITAMLRESALSPDYVFFNAANITSLDLFRFGIQHVAAAPGSAAAPTEPVYVLNRYFLRPGAESREARELHGHARHLRLGDCVAASFAFPGGFEPLIFPHDYFRPGHCPAGPEAAEAARRQFSHSLICDRRPYIAFLDGGLYDNLGLASVEDIRSFLERRSLEQNRRIHYVIATDVDNIQPGIGFYDEPSLDRRLGAESPAPAPPGGRAAGRARQPRARLLSPVLALLALPPLLGFLVGLLAARPPAPGWLLLSAGAVLALALLVGVLPLLRRLRPRPADGLTWRVRLGLSPEFDRQGLDNDLGSFLLRLLLGLLVGPDRATHAANLKAAILERRVGQLLPAFNGYLKRTRSLTYGYLQKTYEPVRPSGEPVARCHLIRNMIFELLPGPDVDPAYAADLITLPVKDYQRQQAIDPMAPIMRKLRHAEYVRDLLARLDPQQVPRAAAGPLELRRRMDLPLALMRDDRDLLSSLEDLRLPAAASLWTWLTQSLALDAEEACDGAPNPAIGRLVQDVRGVLHQALEEATRAQPGVAEPLLRQRCAVKLSEDATSFSWIPLICEMATNLNTTLWVKGYRWYLPNRLEEQRIVAIGGWYVLPPEQEEERPRLDLGSLPAPAAAITALAGYLNTCFNLLEFFYSSLGSSPLALEELVALLIREPIPHRGDDWLQELVDLPFALRQAAFRRLQRESRRPEPPIQPGEVDLLEPWLTSRDGFPESWRQNFRGGTP